MVVAVAVLVLGVVVVCVEDDMDFGYVWNLAIELSILLVEVRPVEFLVGTIEIVMLHG